jgi:hypothetical protein
MMKSFRELGFISGTQSPSSRSSWGTTRSASPLEGAVRWGRVHETVIAPPCPGYGPAPDSYMATHTKDQLTKAWASLRRPERNSDLSSNPASIRNRAVLKPAALGRPASL